MEICIVDDDRVYQLLMKRLINRIDGNIAIRTFYNGEDAFNYYKNNHCKCQIMLLDINMPKMDGWEFLENINKEDFKTLAFIWQLHLSIIPIKNVLNNLIK